jgi:type IV pilus assembly protein PilQ
MLFNAAGTKLLSLELQASEGDSTSKNISSPRVITLNRKAATISAVSSVTYVSGRDNNGNNITAAASAPITLTVTPSVNPDNRISLELTIAKGTLQVLGAVPNQTVRTDNNTLNTSAIVENGGTVVVGGLAQEGVTGGQERVPFLGDLPYVGFLFKTTTKSLSRGELLIFITPRIVSDALTQR